MTVSGSPVVPSIRIVFCIAEYIVGRNANIVARYRREIDHPDFRLDQLLVTPHLV
jgi:hypothetical protein